MVKALDTPALFHTKGPLYEAPKRPLRAEIYNRKYGPPQAFFEFKIAKAGMYHEINQISKTRGLSQSRNVI